VLRKIFIILLFTASINLYALAQSSPEIDRVDDFIFSSTFSEDTIYPGFKFKNNKLTHFFLGTHYRNDWIVPFRVKIFRLEEFAGGVKILKKGGGVQTKSLRLINGQNKEYVLRTIRKFQDKALPEELKGTAIENFFIDQVSGLHPYGSFVIPYLAEAAGVYHTNPILVYIPYKNSLGEYSSEFGGHLALLEERPDDEHAQLESFGKPTKIIGTEKLIENVYEDNDRYVNQEAMLRARLFDMWVGDWDRHEDQWRWAAFYNEDEVIYSPIPRDRDYVFFSYDGLLPYISSRKWGNRFRRDFMHEITDEFGLNFKAVNIDRAFLYKLSFDDWMRITEELVNRLSDSAIESAFSIWPDTLKILSGNLIIEKLKSRRDQLGIIAAKYYSLLAKKVDVVGSDKHELFEIERIKEGEVLIKVSKINKNGIVRRKLYQRLFKSSETSEINVYGNKGQDIFKLSGSSQSNIKIRIIGGDGKDQVEDLSTGQNKKRMTQVYDIKSGNSLNLGTNTKLKTSLDTAWKRFDYFYFKYNYGVPQLFAGFNSDDGVLAGGGLKFIKFGFGKLPYKSSHSYLGRVSFRTGAAEIRYTGEYKSVFKGWDLITHLRVPLPTITRNFFGFGNDTKQVNPDDDFNRMRFKQVTFNPYLIKTFREKHSFSYGIYYQFTDLGDTTNKFINEAFIQNKDKLADPWHYIGLRLTYEYEVIDHENVTTKGIDFENEALWQIRVNGNYNSYLQLKTDLRLYYPLIPSLGTVIAFRVGAAHNVGDFEFFQTNTIGGSRTVRGFRSNRFSGRTSFYQNTELRISLFKFRIPIMSGRLGLIIFNDVGRVWYDGLNSDKWHRGYGGGFMLIPFNFGAITTLYEVSDEKEQFRLKFGFHF